MSSNGSLSHTKTQHTLRSLGVQDSFVLSCTLDTWTEKQVDHMEANGNLRVNQLLEYCVPKAIEVPYLSKTDRDTREYFIRAKYVQQLFKAVPGRSPRAPERIVRQGSNNADNGKSPRSMSAMVEYIGIVTIQLVEGKNLIVKDLTSSDPYCVLTIGLQSRKSKIKYKTLNPTYNESFDFSWNGADQLTVEVFDKDELTRDDHMGKAEVCLEPLLRESGLVLRDWYTIRHRASSYWSSPSPRSSSIHTGIFLMCQFIMYIRRSFFHHHSHCHPCVQYYL
jgi:stromal membrane-associated protein